MIYYFSKFDNFKNYTVLQTLDNYSGYILAKTDQKIKEYEPIAYRHTLLYSIVTMISLFSAIPAFMIYDKIKKERPIKKLINSDRNQDIVRISPKIFFEHKAEIEKFILKLVKNKRKFDVILDGDAENATIETGEEYIEYNYSGKQLAELWEFNNALKKKGMKNSIRFNEFHETETYEDLDKSFSLEQVIEANHQIDEIVNTIKINNFSPYEAMVYIHKFLTSILEYNFQAEIENSNEHGSIVSALQNKKTVCVGFASLTKAIIDKLNMPGLSCNYQNVYILYLDNDQRQDLGHALNLINIDDKKYGIKGTFANDAQLDCKNINAPDGKGYATFMFPLVDLENFRYRSTFTPMIRSSRTHGMTRDIVWDAWRNSDGAYSAIPFEKTKQAITHVYSMIDDFHKNKSAEQATQDDLELTMCYAFEAYRSWAKNPFLKEIKKMHTEFLPNNKLKITFTNGNHTELSI